MDDRIKKTVEQDPSDLLWDGCEGAARKLIEKGWTPYPVTLGIWVSGAFLYRDQRLVDRIRGAVSRDP